MPLICCDYGYFGDGDVTSAFLVAVDSSSGALWASVVPPDAGKTPWTTQTLGDSSVELPSFVLAGFTKWLRWLGYSRFKLRSDHAAKNCAPEGVSWQVLRESAPTASHQSNGSAEKAVQTVRAFARTYASVLRDRLAKSKKTRPQQ